MIISITMNLETDIRDPGVDPELLNYQRCRWGCFFIKLDSLIISISLRITTDSAFLTGDGVLDHN